MEIKGTRHTAHVCEADTVSVAGITDESNDDIIAFAAPHSHAGKLSSYWSYSVARYDEGTAVVYFNRD